MSNLITDYDPANYFTVPKGKPFDYDSYETITDRIEFLNKLIEDLADGCDITHSFHSNIFTSTCSHMITSYMHMAKQLMENAENGTV